MCPRPDKMHAPRAPKRQPAAPIGCSRVRHRQCVKTGPSECQTYPPTTGRKVRRIRRPSRQTHCPRTCPTRTHCCVGTHFLRESCRFRPCTGGCLGRKVDLRMSQTGTRCPSGSGIRFGRAASGPECKNQSQKVGARNRSRHSCTLRRFYKLPTEGWFQARRRTHHTPMSDRPQQGCHDTDWIYTPHYCCRERNRACTYIKEYPDNVLW